MTTDSGAAPARQRAGWLARLGTVAVLAGALGACVQLPPDVKHELTCDSTSANNFGGPASCERSPP